MMNLSLINNFRFASLVLKVGVCQVLNVNNRRAACYYNCGCGAWSNGNYRNSARDKESPVAAQRDARGPHIYRYWFNARSSFGWHSVTQITLKK